MDEDELLDEDQFRLFAVTARYPQQLVSKGVPLQPVSEGAYDIHVLTSRVRLIVANQMPQQEHNAMLHLFSAKGELLAYGARHYRIRSTETSTLLRELLKRYQQEALTMPDLLEEFTRDAIDRLLKEMTIEERLEGLSLEERVKGVSVEQLEELVRRLKGNGPAAGPGISNPGN